MSFVKISPKRVESGRAVGRAAPPPARPRPRPPSGPGRAGRGLHSGSGERLPSQLARLAPPPVASRSTADKLSSREPTLTFVLRPSTAELGT
ncbi:hypothetical protein SFRURICE_020900 [Spodoptera frugiperda]|nr:hypothetical protein SFRURICE_020900 [Spodoptera frugiperda]